MKPKTNLYLRIRYSRHATAPDPHFGLGACPKEKVVLDQSLTIQVSSVDIADLQANFRVV